MKELSCFLSANIFSIIDSKNTNNGAKNTMHRLRKSRTAVTDITCN